MGPKAKCRVLMLITSILAVMLLVVLYDFMTKSAIAKGIIMSSFKTIGKPQDNLEKESVDVKSTGKQQGSFDEEAIDVTEFAYSINGKQFDFDSTTYNTAKEILKTQTFKKKPVTMDSKATLPPLVPVTAISSNHFEELNKHLSIMPRIFGADVKLVLFDLGLSDEHIKAIRSIPYVDYRQFNYAKYPPHVKDLYTYAWKVLIIQEMLAEFEAILWMDASVSFIRSYSAAIDQMVREKSGFLFYPVPGENKVIGSTHPVMFDYIPAASMSGVRDTFLQQASGMIIINTLEVQRDVMKWAVLCALYKDCIDHSDATIPCSREFYGQPYYINCHRFDQSLFNVLVANAYNFQVDKYALKGKPFTKLRRVKMVRAKGMVK